MLRCALHDVLNDFPSIYENPFRPQYCLLLSNAPASKPLISDCNFSDS